MVRYCLILLFFLSVESAFAQKLLHGKLVSENEEGLENVHIINRCQDLGTITDAGGFFTIPASEGDTVEIKSIVFKDMTFVINSETLEMLTVDVPVQTRLYSIPNIDLFSNDLSGYLKYDVEQEQDEQMASNAKAPEIEWPKVWNKYVYSSPQYKAERNLYNPDFGRRAPVISLVTFQNKKAKKRETVSSYADKREFVVHEILDNIPANYFTTILHIPPEEHENFVYYCVDKLHLLDIIQSNTPMKVFDDLPLMAEDYIENILKHKQSR